jgi:hypothetical protein
MRPALVIGLALLTVVVAATAVSIAPALEGSEPIPTLPDKGTPPPDEPQPTATLNVPPCFRPVNGDWDGDNRVTMIDALYVLRSLAGLPVPKGGCHMDVDCNWSTDAADLLKILQYVAGIPYEPSGKWWCAPIGSSQGPYAETPPAAP